jgi:hypothetical protein
MSTSWRWQRHFLNNEYAFSTDGIQWRKNVLVLALPQKATESGVATLTLSESPK